MQSHLELWEARLGNRNMLLASGLAVAVAIIGFVYLKNRLGAPMIDELQGYDRELLTDHLLLYGAEGRRLHQLFTLTLDMAFPFAYGAFFGGLLVLVGRGTPLPHSVLVIVPLMLLDLAENIQIARIMTGFPDLTDGQISAASATTEAKFWASRFALWWLLGLGLAQIWRRFRPAKP